MNLARSWSEPDLKAFGVKARDGSSEGVCAPWQLDSLGGQGGDLCCRYRPTQLLGFGLCRLQLCLQGCTSAVPPQHESLLQLSQKVFGSSCNFTRSGMAF